MFAIATCDQDWFERIQRQPPGQVINFWKPTPRTVRLVPGVRLYFMLKVPIRKIAGYGQFIRWRSMTAMSAWDEYGSRNGVDSREELISKLETYAMKRSPGFVPTGNPIIGCMELTDISMLRRLVSVEECGLEFPPNNPTYQRFPDPDMIETRSHEPPDAPREVRYLTLDDI